VDASRMDQLRAWLIGMWSIEVATCIAACIARPLANLESMGLIFYSYHLGCLTWALCFFLLKMYEVRRYKLRSARSARPPYLCVCIFDAPSVVHCGLV
jgi:hypothetical protein